MHEATSTRHYVGEKARASLREAAVTMLAAIATLGVVLTIDPEAPAGVLAVVLSISLARSHLDHGLRERLEAAVALPVVALVATGVGLLLHRLPWIGALVFTTGMAGLVLVRRFGAIGPAARLPVLPPLL